MAKQTKLNFIELITGVKEDGEFETKVYFTPKFIPFTKVTELTETFDSIEEESSDAEALNKMFDTVVDLYNNQFTVEELKNGLHAPEAVETLQQQIQFIAAGQMSEERQAELKKLLK